MEMSQSDLLEYLQDLGLSELLINFICEAYLNKPNNLIDFAIQFFISLKENNRKSSIVLDVTKNNANKLRTISPLNLKSESLHDISNLISIDHNSLNLEKDFNNEKNEIEINRLRVMLKKINFFKWLNNDQLNDLINTMKLRNFSKDEVIIRQGDDGDYFYIVEDGIFCVYKILAKNALEYSLIGSNSLKLVETYVNSGHFGELALIYNQPRSATVIAQSSGSLWCIDRITFKQSIQKYTIFDNLLKNYEPFQNLNAYNRKNLIESLIEKRYTNNQLIYKKDDIGNYMFFVASGSVELVFEEIHKLSFVSKRSKAKKQSLKLDKTILTISNKNIENNFNKLYKLSSYYPSSVKDIKHKKFSKIKLLKEGDYFGESCFTSKIKRREFTAFARGDDVELVLLSIDSYKRLINK